MNPLGGKNWARGPDRGADRPDFRADRGRREEGGFRDDFPGAQGQQGQEFRRGEGPGGRGEAEDRNELRFRNDRGFKRDVRDVRDFGGPRDGPRDGPRELDRDPRDFHRDQDRRDQPGGRDSRDAEDRRPGWSRDVREGPWPQDRGPPDRGLERPRLDDRRRGSPSHRDNNRDRSRERDRSEEQDDAGRGGGAGGAGGGPWGPRMGSRSPPRRGRGRWDTPPGDGADADRFRGGGSGGSGGGGSWGAERGNRPSPFTSQPGPPPGGGAPPGPPPPPATPGLGGVTPGPPVSHPGGEGGAGGGGLVPPGPPPGAPPPPESMQVPPAPPPPAPPSLNVSPETQTDPTPEAPHVPRSSATPPLPPPLPPSSAAFASQTPTPTPTPISNPAVPGPPATISYKPSYKPAPPPISFAPSYGPRITPPPVLSPAPRPAATSWAARFVHQPAKQARVAVPEVPNPEDVAAREARAAQEAADAIEAQEAEQRDEEEAPKSRFGQRFGKGLSALKRAGTEPSPSLSLGTEPSPSPSPASPALPTSTTSALPDAPFDLQESGAPSPSPAPAPQQQSGPVTKPVPARSATKKVPKRGVEPPPPPKFPRRMQPAKAAGGTGGVQGKSRPSPFTSQPAPALPKRADSSSSPSSSSSFSSSATSASTSSSSSSASADPVVLAASPYVSLVRMPAAGPKIKLSFEESPKKFALTPQMVVPPHAKVRSGEALSEREQKELKAEVEEDLAEQGEDVEDPTVAKQAILALIQKLDEDMSKKEGTRSRLTTELTELEAPPEEEQGGEEGEGRSEEEVEEPFVNEKVEYKSLTEKFLAENRRRAGRAHRHFDHMVQDPLRRELLQMPTAESRGPARISRQEKAAEFAGRSLSLGYEPLYAAPVDADLFRESVLAFPSQRDTVFTVLMRRRMKDINHWRKLAVQYAKLGKEWVGRVRAGENEQDRASLPLPEASPYRYLNSVRSEAELNEVINELQQEEIKRIKYHKSRARLPRMISSKEPGPVFLSRNGFVADSKAEELRYQHVNPWTAEENEIFQSRYVKNPKQFRKIATHLPNKTTNDCVAYYYYSKMKVNYKALIRASSRKPGKGHKAGDSMGALGGEPTNKGMVLGGPKRELMTAGVNKKTRNSGNRELIGLLGMDGTFDMPRGKRGEGEEVGKATPNGGKPGPGDEDREPSPMVDGDEVEEGEGEKEEAREQSPGGLEGEDGQGQEQEQKPKDPTKDPTKEKEKEKDKDAGSSWTALERAGFQEGLATYGQDWAQIAGLIGTKAPDKVKRYFKRHRKKLGLDEHGMPLETGGALDTLPLPERPDTEGKGDQGDQGDTQDTDMSDNEVPKQRRSGKRHSSHWTTEEKDQFMAQLDLSGRDWKALSIAVPTRSESQIKNFYQNYKGKLGLSQVAEKAAQRQGEGGERGATDRGGGGGDTDAEDAPGKSSSQDKTKTREGRREARVKSEKGEGKGDKGDPPPPPRDSAPGAAGDAGTGVVSGKGKAALAPASLTEGTAGQPVQHMLNPALLMTPGMAFAGNRKDAAQQQALWQSVLGSLHPGGGAAGAQGQGGGGGGNSKDTEQQQHMQALQLLKQQRQTPGQPGDPGTSPAGMGRSIGQSMEQSMGPGMRQSMGQGMGQQMGQQMGQYSPWQQFQQFHHLQHLKQLQTLQAPGVGPRGGGGVPQSHTPRTAEEEQAANLEAQKVAQQKEAKKLRRRERKRKAAELKAEEKEGVPQGPGPGIDGQQPLKRSKPSPAPSPGPGSVSGPVSATGPTPDPASETDMQMEQLQQQQEQQLQSMRYLLARQGMSGGPEGAGGSIGEGPSEVASPNTLTQPSTSPGPPPPSSALAQPEPSPAPAPPLVPAPRGSLKRTRSDQANAATPISTPVPAFTSNAYAALAPADDSDLEGADVSSSVTAPASLPSRSPIRTPSSSTVLAYASSQPPSPLLGEPAPCPPSPPSAPSSSSALSLLAMVGIETEAKIPDPAPTEEP